MTLYLADPDFTLYVGDVREVLATMPDESVDCVVTSPPYWGLRDYGTGAWDGGDPACDHLGEPFRTKSKLNENWGAGFADVKNAEGREPMGQTCSKCGAQRVDQQLGLEATPDEYVQAMVGVFREVRRVLSPWGTCWLNLGDSYAGGGGYAPNAPSNQAGGVNRSAKTFETRKRHPHFNGLKEKDLVGIPWRVAFALQADGWWLRSEIIWAKPNPMPESVTDRPTKSHEQVFLLAKAPRYWFDAEAVREPHAEVSIARADRARLTAYAPPGQTPQRRGPDSDGLNPAGRNVRSVWEIAEEAVDGDVTVSAEALLAALRDLDPGALRDLWNIATQPYPEAHFATYPQELVRRCLLAGCPEWVCSVCARPRERIVEPTAEYAKFLGRGYTDHERDLEEGMMQNRGVNRQNEMVRAGVTSKQVQTVGWSDCGHNAYRPGIVLDPFLGSGTTALVARHHGRHAVGIELNADYAALAAERLSQLSLLA